MSPAHNPLQRFRPVGSPGAATAAGVPVGQPNDPRAELAPVFARLRDTDRECANIAAAGERSAADVRARDAERAQGVLDAARRRAPAERAAAAARYADTVRKELDTVLAAGTARAEEVRRRMLERRPAAIRQLAAEALGVPDTSGTGT